MVGLAELYDRFRAIITLDRRVQTLEEQVTALLPRLDEVFMHLVRLDGRVETVKAETLAEFYRQVAGTPSPPPPGHPDRPALPLRRRRRRSR